MCTIIKNCRVELKRLNDTTLPINVNNSLMADGNLSKLCVLLLIFNSLSFTYIASTCVDTIFLNII